MGACRPLDTTVAVGTDSNEPPNCREGEIFCSRPSTLLLDCSSTLTSTPEFKLYNCSLHKIIMWNMVACKLLCGILTCSDTDSSKLMCIVVFASINIAKRWRGGQVEWIHIRNEASDVDTCGELARAGRRDEVCEKVPRWWRGTTNLSYTEEI